MLTAVDEAYVYDNSGWAPRLTFSKTGGVFRACEELTIGPERLAWVKEHIIKPLAKREIEAGVFTLYEMEIVFTRKKYGE